MSSDPYGNVKLYSMLQRAVSAPPYLLSEV